MPLWTTPTVYWPPATPLISQRPLSVLQLCLASPLVSSTVPSATLEALHDHGSIRPDTIRGTYAQSHETIDELARIGVSLDEVTSELERAGIDAFGESWGRLVAAIRG